jgi:hypothetical protein
MSLGGADNAVPADLVGLYAHIAGTRGSVLNLYRDLVVKS